MKTSTKPSPKYSEFILAEQKKRGISLREFADYVGVASSTIIRAANHDTAAMPTIEILTKLSKATGVDICVLLSLVAPDAISEGDDPEDRLLADRIRRLSPDAHKMVESFVINATFENAQKNS